MLYTHWSCQELCGIFQWNQIWSVDCFSNVFDAQGQEDDQSWCLNVGFERKVNLNYLHLHHHAFPRYHKTRGRCVNGGAPGICPPPLLLKLFLSAGHFSVDSDSVDFEIRIKGISFLTWCIFYLGPVTCIKTGLTFWCSVRFGVNMRNISIHLFQGLE